MNLGLDASKALAAIASHDDPEWLADRRAEAVERLRTFGFPAGRDPAWKGSDVAAFTAHTEVAETANEISAAEIESYFLPDVANRIVLVDGAYRQDLTQLELPHRVHVEALAEAILNGSVVLKEHFDQTANSDPFSDWNTAGFTDGVFLTTAEETVFEHPIHILQVRTKQAGTVCFPRVIIHLRERSEISVIEHHVGIGDADTTTVAVTELVAHPGAHLHHDRIQQEWTTARHMHSIRIRADENATVRHGNANTGAAHGRVTVDGIMAGEGSSIEVVGFSIAGGLRKTDIWSRLDHTVPHTRSDELVKFVLGDNAHGAFTGEVMVRPSAQKTVAAQENRNLLLSRKALMDSKPQLQIEADDVQCSHGSTIGRLDEAALFFLRTRGIGKEDAKIILTKAFLGEVIGRMNSTIHPYLNGQVDAWFERHPQTLKVIA
jgi:Fe-S cluster assembly protein SufD